MTAEPAAPAIACSRSWDVVLMRSFNPEYNDSDADAQPVMPGRFKEAPRTPGADAVGTLGANLRTGGFDRALSFTGQISSVLFCYGGVS